jgi:hypothetical protein
MEQSLIVAVGSLLFAAVGMLAIFGSRLTRNETITAAHAEILRELRANTKEAADAAQEAKAAAQEVSNKLDTILFRIQSRELR